MKGLSNIAAKLLPSSVKVAYVVSLQILIYKIKDVRSQMCRYVKEIWYCTCSIPGISGIPTNITIIDVKLRHNSLRRLRIMT